MGDKVFGLCSLAVMIAAAVIVVMAFYNIFKNQLTTETEVGVIQRQLRGFALLTVASLVMMIGMALCGVSMISNRSA